MRMGDLGERGDLLWHWGTAYDITYRLGHWRAIRRDTREALHADDPEELRVKIRQDYTERPVPR